MVDLILTHSEEEQTLKENGLFIEESFSRNIPNSSPPKIIKTSEDEWERKPQEYNEFVRHIQLINESFISDQNDTSFEELNLEDYEECKVDKPTFLGTLMQPQSFLYKWKEKQRNLAE